LKTKVESQEFILQSRRIEHSVLVFVCHLWVI